MVWLVKNCTTSGLCCEVGRDGGLSPLCLTTRPTLKVILAEPRYHINFAGQGMLLHIVKLTTFKLKLPAENMLTLEIFAGICKNSWISWHFPAIATFFKLLYFEYARNTEVTWGYWCGSKVHNLTKYNPSQLLFLSTEALLSTQLSKHKCDTY